MASSIDGCPSAPEHGQRRQALRRSDRPQQQGERGRKEAGLDRHGVPSSKAKCTSNKPPESAEHLFARFLQSAQDAPELGSAHRTQASELKLNPGTSRSTRRALAVMNTPRIESHLPATHRRSISKPPDLTPLLLRHAGDIGEPSWKEDRRTQNQSQPMVSKTAIASTLVNSPLAANVSNLGHSGLKDVVEVDPRGLVSLPQAVQEDNVHGLQHRSQNHVLTLLLSAFGCLCYLYLVRAGTTPPGFVMTSQLVNAQNHLRQADACLPEGPQLAHVREEIRKADRCMATTISEMDNFAAWFCTSTVRAVYATTDPQNHFQYIRVVWAEWQLKQAALRIQQLASTDCALFCNTAVPLLASVQAESQLNLSRISHKIKVNTNNILARDSRVLNQAKAAQVAVNASLGHAAQLLRLSAQEVSPQHQRLLQIMAIVKTSRGRLEDLKSTQTWSRPQSDRTLEAAKQLKDNFEDAMSPVLSIPAEWRSFIASCT